MGECLSRLDVRYHDWFVAQVEDRTTGPRDKLLSVFDVLDEWFTSKGFRGCAFINASVDLADPHHPARVPVLAHKRRNRDYITELAVEAGIEDPQAFAQQMMLLVEGTTITALPSPTPPLRSTPNAAQTLIAGWRSHPTVRPKPELNQPSA